jgi:hypothetical protein
MLKELVPTDSNYTKSRTVYFKKTEINNPNFGGFNKNYADYLVFVFTPFNAFKLNDGEVENSLGKFKLNYSGNIRNHKYQCYQKKLEFVDGINNKIYSQSTTLSKEKRNSLLLNIEQKDNNLSDLFPFNKSSSKKIPINNLIKDTKINSLSENKKYKHLLGIKRNFSFEEELE